MANFVLFTWPLVSFVLFAWLGRERGLIWSTLLGYLFLPEAITHELSGLPDYDKFLAISLGLALGAVAFHHKPSFQIGLVAPPPRDIDGEIAAIWEEILETEDIDRKKSITDLGGSMRQARVVVRRMARIGVPMKQARTVYEGATIADLTRITPIDGPSRLGSHTLAIALYILLGILLFAAVMTVQTNPEAIVTGPSVRSGLTYRDVVSMVSEPLIAMTPFFLALRFLRSRTHQEEVLKAIVIVGVFYAGLAAVEARLSPQFNVWVYGYFQHSWIQHLRDGFRPIVFLRHGLWLGFFLLTVALAAFAMFRQTKTPVRFAYLAAGIWAFGVLLISRNLGATMLAVIFAPVVLLAPQFIQTRVAAAAAALLLAYPVIWQSGVLPIEEFVAWVASISEERAQTFQFRLDNEAAILGRALEKPLFGWGSWDRWRVFDENGRDLTTVDGIWILTLGERGWVGYICFFGIVTLPLFFLVRAARIKERSQVVIGMALITAANLIYMIPNSTLSPVGWLMIGTIAGYTRWFLVEVDAEEIERPDETERAFSPYTRFAHTHRREAHGG